MSSTFSQYFSPKHILSLAKVGNRIRILRGRLDGREGNLEIGKTYTITGVFSLRPSRFNFTIQEDPDLYLQIDSVNGYAAELADAKDKKSFISVSPKNEPESDDV